MAVAAMANRQGHSPQNATFFLDRHHSIKCFLSQGLALETQIQIGALLVSAVKLRLKCRPVFDNGQPGHSW
jgi:hypothetical protein